MTDEENTFWQQNSDHEAPQTQYNINQQMSEPQYYNNQQGMPTQVPPSQPNYYQQGTANQIHGQPSTIPLGQGISATYYPETSAMTAIILSALSFVMCGILLSIPGVIMARKALDITDQIPNHPDAGTAKAAFVLGWINIGFTALLFVSVISLTVISVAFS